MARTSTIIRDGTSQKQRLLPALDDGYIDVDEMRLASLLAMSREYAGLLKYFDGDNREDGDWSALFDAEEANIFASILATSLKQAEADFFGLLSKLHQRPGMLHDGSIDPARLPAVALAQRIDSWFVKLGALQNDAAMQLHEKIGNLIGKTLAHELHHLLAFVRQSGAVVETGLPQFAPEWTLGAVRRMHWPPHDAPHALAQFLKDNFYAFHNAVLFLQEHSGALLQSSLQRSDHDPAAGLFIAFLKLFSGVQRKLNSFTRKHLDFYYSDVLQVRHREFVPDSTYLLFSPDVAGREVMIAKGTEFLAGLDENNIDLIYAADDDLLVTDARVCALHTFYLERNAVISPENSLFWPDSRKKSSQQFATAAKLNRIELPQPDAGVTGSELEAQPLFGDPRRHKNKRFFEDARLGLAVASSVLLLEQGQRDVSVTFRLAASGSGEDTLGSFIDSLGAVSANREDAFFKVFRNMFRISLTSEAGWLEIEEYLPLCSCVGPEGCESDSFKVQFRLPDSAAAIVPYAPALHGGGFDTDLPLVRFTLNPGAYLYPYSLLSELVVREIVIETKVVGARGMLVYNQLGQLNPDAQFSPFGPSPAQGDYLVVGCYEAARKRLLDFEVEIEWSGLPPGMRDFGDYYREYSGIGSNDAFRAKLAVLRDRKWIPADMGEQPETALFESLKEEGEASRICRKRRLSFRGLCRFLRPLEGIAEERYGYDAAAKDGFFRIALGNPPGAFGHKDYPTLLSRTMTENARLKRFGLARLLLKAHPDKPLPNAPYTPLINSIAVNYRATASISLEQVASADEEDISEKIFHLHPLGLESPSPKSYARIHMVPRYDADGNLLIGIAASRLAGPLTLFFHLREDSLPEAGGRELHFTWHYLASNRWKKLDRSRVVADGTRGFLASGIVTLDLPADIDQASTIMPSGMYWLRVAASGDNFHTLCSLYAVYAQALKVSWKAQQGNDHAHLEHKLPAGTIKDARYSLPGIAGMRQVVDSFGGMPAEQNRQRTVRVSERLKHKNRAVTAWDYERLILQRFPEIYKVKCFPCMSGDDAQAGETRPGQLLIVVLPYLKEGAATNSMPMGNALLLREVREFVAGLSSAFAEITVRNPAYEQVQVHCRVGFKKGREPGLCLRQLNQEIFDYLFPWSPGGQEARFGWSIRCSELQSFIRSREYVETVSGLSLLHLSELGRHKHQLFDTARRHVGEIGPIYPWSIAVPFRHHLIEVMSDGRFYKPDPTGISRLSIGSTFILSRGNQ